MARKTDKKFVESTLTKGELRKLNALRKSLGDEIAEKAFSEWYEQKQAEGTAPSDKNAQLIADTLQPLIEKNQLKFPKSGYLVKRGRGRVIVEAVTN